MTTIIDKAISIVQDEYEEISSLMHRDSNMSDVQFAALDGQLELLARVNQKLHGLKIPGEFKSDLDRALGDMRAEADAEVVEEIEAIINTADSKDADPGPGLRRST